MSYQIRFTDPNTPPIDIRDKTIDNETTSLTFIGKGYTSGYGQFVAENFLHLLENFARSTPPENAVTGQLWFDTRSGENNQLKVFPGESGGVGASTDPDNWLPAGNIKKSPIAPSKAIVGDLWSDTNNQQLYLYNGSQWILVGPQFSPGKRTGAEVELISDADSDQDKTVLTLYSNGERLCIISDVEFRPRITVEGFSSIKPGLNLSEKRFSLESINKIWGTSEKSESLIVGSAIVAANNFLRSDVTSTTNFGFNVRNDAGISIGGNLALSINIVNNSVVFSNRITGSSFDFNLKTASQILTVLKIDSINDEGRLGVNKNDPDVSLDVNGDIKSNSRIIIEGSTSPNSITTTGGVDIQGGLIVRSSMTVQDVSNFGNILPKSDNLHDLGDPNQKIWRSIYSNNVRTNNLEVNTISGLNNALVNVNGNITGTAKSLQNSIKIRLTGDVSTGEKSFGGINDVNSVELNTSIIPDFIGTKTETINSFSTDEFLVKQGNSNQLFRIKKETIFKNIATVPVGSIFPFAGITIPQGYLLCDGSEQLLSVYPDLFAVIGYTYRPLSQLVGPTNGVSTFALPDLRGRFPLGIDNMSNAGANTPANRVTDLAADELGGAGGRSQVTLNRNNLPDHKHDLKGSTGTQYYTINDLNTVPQDQGAFRDQGPSAPNDAQYNPFTGAVYMDDLVNKNLSQPFDVVNQYLAINYIIFTGRVA